MARLRWACLPALATLLVVAAGCDLSALPYFLSGADSRLPPDLMSLTPKDKDAQVHVVVLVHSGLLADPQLMTADREVTRRIIRALQDALHDPKNKDTSKDSVKFTSASQIERYKDAHPDWHMNLVEAGKHFHADFVIYLDMEALSLYENKSYNEMLHARADIALKVIDMHQPDDPVKEKDLRCEYPRTSPVPVEDQRLDQFRNSFYQEIATQVCWLFARHETPSSF